MVRTPFLMLNGDLGPVGFENHASPKSPPYGVWAIHLVPGPYGDTLSGASNSSSNTRLYPVRSGAESKISTKLHITETTSAVSKLIRIRQKRLIVGGGMYQLLSARIVYATPSVVFIQLIISQPKKHPCRRYEKLRESQIEEQKNPKHAHFVSSIYSVSGLEILR